MIYKLYAPDGEKRGEFDSLEAAKGDAEFAAEQRLEWRSLTSIQMVVGKCAGRSSEWKIIADAADTISRLRSKMSIMERSRSSCYYAGRIQPRDVARNWGIGSNLGDALKYIFRAGPEGSRDSRKDGESRQEALVKAVECLETELRWEREGEK